MSGSYRTHDGDEKILPHFGRTREKEEEICVAGKGSEPLWIGRVEMHLSEPV